MCEIFCYISNSKKSIKIKSYFSKNKEGKEKWREWCEQYKETVQDYNFGSLLRLNPTEDYSEQNSCFALRVQLGCFIFRNFSESFKIASIHDFYSLK